MKMSRTIKLSLIQIPLSQCKTGTMIPLDVLCFASISNFDLKIIHKKSKISIKICFILIPLSWCKTGTMIPFDRGSLFCSNFQCIPLARCNNLVEFSFLPFGVSFCCFSVLFCKPYSSSGDCHPSALVFSCLFATGCIPLLFLLLNISHYNLTWKQQRSTDHCFGNHWLIL